MKQQHVSEKEVSEFSFREKVKEYDHAMESNREEMFKMTKRVKDCEEENETLRNQVG